MKSKAEVQEFQEAQLLELIRDAVDDLNRLADKLERYANEKLEHKQYKGEGNA